MNNSKTSLWIKICGLTDEKTAYQCSLLGPDAIGLVFFSKSPRFVTNEIAAGIVSVLPQTCTPVGVFVNDSYDTIMHIVEKTGIRGVQLHGQETPELVEQLEKQNLKVLKALFEAVSPRFENASQYSSASYFLVEYGKGALPGGNAHAWDYSVCKALQTDIPVILAGGLTPDNVAQAVALAKPFGVDISSGVEISPGEKSIKKIKQFILAARY